MTNNSVVLCDDSSKEKGTGAYSKHGNAPLSGGQEQPIPAAIRTRKIDHRNAKGEAVEDKGNVRQGTLPLMVLKTLDMLGPQHVFSIARRIEQISGESVAVNQGTLYPLLVKLENEGTVATTWGSSEDNRRTRYYRLTQNGRKQLQAETRDWERTTEIVSRFFTVKAEDFV